MKQSFLSIAFFCFLFSFAKAQIDYPIFKNRIEISPADSGKLSLSIYNLNYEYNTEWFGKMPNSGTLFGYELVPELQYQPAKRFVLKGGIFLQKEFGRPDYTVAVPTFAAKIFFKHSSFLFGTIEGELNHQFIEPLYDYKILLTQRALGFYAPENASVSPLENGVQYVVDKKHYWQDLFVNWRKAIHLNDPFREQIDLGYSAKFKVYNHNKFQISIPLQILQTHKGGQIASTTVPDQTLFDMATGLSLNFKLNNFLKQITAENFYVNYRNLTNAPQPFDRGNAYYSHLLLKSKYNVDLDFRYWDGYGFIAWRGNPLFQSVSEKIPGYTEPHRQLLLMSAIYDKEIFKNVNVHFLITPYYDFGEKLIEYSYEVYIRYRVNIFLKRIKNTF